MDVATLSTNGQITVPRVGQQRACDGSGDKIVFLENEYGDIVLVRPAAAALLEAQRAFRGAANSAGFETEDELDNYVADLRKERGGRLSA